MFQSLLKPASYSEMFTIILLRYVVLALLAFVIFYSFKNRSWLPRKIQQAFPKNKDYWREIGYSVITSAIFAGVGYMIFLTPFRKYTQLYTHFSDHSLAYFFFSLGLTFFVHDTYFYWTHRFMHHASIYKYVHRVHHLSVNPSPWASMAFHPIEAVVEAGIIIVIVMLFPVHPLTIGLFLLFMMIYNVYGHLGYELYPRGFSRGFIGGWINTSVNHNQHHHYFKGNYGLYFLWWDRWMGTLREDYDKEFDEVKS